MISTESRNFTELRYMTDRNINSYILKTILLITISDMWKYRKKFHTYFAVAETWIGNASSNDIPLFTWLQNMQILCHMIPYGRFTSFL